MTYFRSPENRDSSPGLARRLRSCSRLDRVRPETLATPLLGDSLKPSGIAPSGLHKSKTPGPLVPPFWVRPPRGPNPTIRLAGEPALFHIINSVTIIGFVGADPEQRQARNNNGSKFTVLSVATQRSWKNTDDEWASKTEWHRVCVFRPRLAEYKERFARARRGQPRQHHVRTRKRQRQESENQQADVLVHSRSNCAAKPASSLFSVG